MVGRIFWVFSYLGEGVGVAGSERRKVGDRSYVGCRTLMPAVMGFRSAFLVPASVAFGSPLVGVAILDAKVAVEEDQGED